MEPEALDGVGVLGYRGERRATPGFWEVEFFALVQGSLVPPEHMEAAGIEGGKAEEEDLQTLGVQAWELHKEALTPQGLDCAIQRVAREDLLEETKGFSSA
jgi:hypothetical protein